MNSDFQLLLIFFLMGAFAASGIHQLISYLSRRKRPFKFIFFVWVVLFICVSIQLYGLYAGKEMAATSFVTHILIMAVFCFMLSHLAYGHATRHLNTIGPAASLAIFLSLVFPDQYMLIYGVAQILTYAAMSFLLYKIYLLRKPYFLMLLVSALPSAFGFLLFGAGPLGIVPYFPFLGKMLMLICLLASVVLYYAYLTQVAALTSKKLVENEFITNKLKELDHLKTKFFSNITHEFRTPLTLIQGPACELMERTEDKEAHRLLGMIQNNSARLLKLINQLLDLAKLDAHEMQLTYRSVRLGVFLKTIIPQFASHAASRSILFEYHFHEEDVTVSMDDEKVETILINIISNAIKFTPIGGSVSVVTSFKNNLFEVVVKDSGRGIPPEKIPHIFDRFYQVEASDSSHAEGTGIGLALVKEYVELMKGIIHVESRAGVGTSMKVSLALETATTQPLPSSKKLVEEAALIPEEISNGNEALPVLLIVEDNADIRLFIKTCMGNLYRYSEAGNGREGLEKARQEIPDLIISDLMMPEMDGLELCLAIKKDDRTNHIPFIMLTAKAAEENKLEGLKTGADDYLIKPFNKSELALKVQNLVLLREKLQAHIKKHLLAQATPVEAASAAEQFIVKARTFIEAHLSDETLNVETLAGEMNLGREQCYRKIIALTGLSPSAFIRKLRLQKAALLLGTKWGPVSQVAYEVGFGNLSYFSKAFKEEFGKVPSEY